MICGVIELSRTVRLCLNGPSRRGSAATDNTFAAWPPMRGLGRYYELTVTCRGEADAASGYFLNIKVIDQAVRQHVLPGLERLIGDGGASADVPMGEVMRRIMAWLGPPLRDTASGARLHLTPWLSLTIRSDAMHEVLIGQQYEFSASHRLHVPQWDARRNREVFGKCNNPAGHGHNYRVEVVAAAPIDQAGHVAAAEDLDAIVDRVVVQRFDHKNLDVDVTDFQQCNSSVENIAVVVHGLLRDPLAEAGLRLEQVSVWETGKTVCTYRGG
jgi:6-pyruvoyltetrahydropterin/6-carboxytetrahydropterin synthase